MSALHGGLQPKCSHSKIAFGLVANDARSYQGGVSAASSSRPALPPARHGSQARRQPVSLCTPQLKCARHSFQILVMPFARGVGLPWKGPSVLFPHPPLYRRLTASASQQPTVATGAPCRESLLAHRHASCNLGKPTC